MSLVGRITCSRKRIVCFFLTIHIFLIIMLYLCSIVFRTVPFYSKIKSNQRGWSGRVHTYDPELGFSPIPASEGAEILLGSEIPMRYDEDGFRVPIGTTDTSSQSRPLVLALGCSFTYGFGVYAEEAYPYLVGQYLGGSTINAGVSSYGLSQMWILAGRLIPLHKPDYIMVQYSPWLVARAQRPFAPTFYGKLPTPFFIERGDSLALHPPVFATKNSDFPVSYYRKSKKGILDFMSFLSSVALPLTFYNDSNLLSYHIKAYLNVIPSSNIDSEDIIQFVYGDIARIAKEHKARMVVVVLGADHRPVNVSEHIWALNPITVQAHSALTERLPAQTREAYLKAYAHRRGSPPVLVDVHPNPHAHSIIAEAIVKRMKGRN